MLFNCSSVISGIGSYFPNQVVTSRELLEEIQSERRFGISHDYLDTKIGIRERRYAPDNIKPSELALLAAERAMKDAGIEAIDLDAIIYCGITGDQIEPSTAHNIQAALQANNALCRDVHNACHGFTDGIQIADMMIGHNAGHILVVTAELTRVSRSVMPILEKTADFDVFMHKIGVLTVGDGAGAMVISQKENQPYVIEKINTRSWGQYSDLCTYDMINGKFTGGIVMDKISGVMLRLSVS